MKTYLLYETANSCAGSTKLITKLIESLPKTDNSGINPHTHFGFDSKNQKLKRSKMSVGVKFQVYKYSEIALADYEWYPVYKQTFVNPQNWKKIFTYAKNRGFDVWIDVFDLYSVGVIKDNLAIITGIKLQSSVLDNLKVLAALSEAVGNKKTKIILNIAGRELSNIKEKLADLKNNYFFKNEIILQAGFQAYPTDKEDLTLSKVQLLRLEFPDTTTSYADHVDGKSPLAFDVPVFAVLAGAGHIEKHVCLDRNKTKYDFQSAIEPDECALLIYKIKECEKILGTKLIPDKEANYLKTTIEKPIAAIPMRAGDVINFKNFDFRRTGQEGLTVSEIKEMMNPHTHLGSGSKSQKFRQSKVSVGMKKRYVLAKDIKPGQTIKANDMRKARVGVVIACRMKSTRLKHKAILPIQGIASIERCIINAKKIKSADEIILATSTIEEDQILKKYALKQKIHFFAGDPEDVMLRYLGVAEKYKLDIIIRVTGDCPIVSYEMAEFLLQRHFEKGNDYTGPKEYCTGQNSEIYNVNTMKRIMEYLGNARHSEYMTWYMITNKDIFQVDMADLPKEWIRTYRLTLDVQEDLDIFNALFEKLGNKEASIKNVFAIIDKEPRIHELNDAMVLKYKSDKKLIDMLNKETRIILPKSKK